MKLFYPEEHFICSNYISPEIDFGFKILRLSEQEEYKKDFSTNNVIVFLLKGNIKIECNDSNRKQIADKEFFLIPQSSSFTLNALTESHLIIYLFSGQVSMLCEYSNLLNYSSYCSDFKYNFKVLQFNRPLEMYIELLDVYLQAGLNCVHLHQFKQQELFLLLRTTFTKQDVYEFFYPILGSDVDFKSKLLMKYKYEYNTKEMAKEMAMSTIYFSRRFKGEFGESFYKWTLSRKSQCIKRKLCSPCVTISEIIEEFKFSSPSHFYKFCVHEFGCTPSEFIRKLRHHNSK